MKNIKNYRPCIGIFLLALLVRVIYNLTAGHNYVPKDDAALYNNLALGMLVQHCYCFIGIHHANVSRAPLWPFIIYVIYFFAGPHEIYPRLFYCLLGAGTCILIYFFARDLFGKRVAFLTGILAAIYPGLFLFDGWLFSESLYTFLSTSLIYSLYRIQYILYSSSKDIGSSVRDTWRSMGRYLILSGFCLGLASLTRPNGPVLFGLIVIWGLLVALTKRMSRRSGIWSILIIAGIALAIIAPWTYRNYRVTHSFVLVALGGGDVLVGSYNDTVLTNASNTGPGFWVSKDLVQPHVDTLSHDDWRYTPQDDKADTIHAFRWIETHLQDMPYLLGWHLIHMWSPYTFEPALPIMEHPEWLSSRIIFTSMYVMSIPVFLLAAAGIMLTWKSHRTPLIAVYTTIVLTIGQNLALYANIRFRAPIEPLLVILVGGVLWRLVQVRSIKPQASRTPTSVSES